MDGMTQILKLVDVVDCVDGRKKFQKIVHILQTMGFEFPQQFGYLHYGPYSSELAAQIDSLVKGNLIEEERRSGEYETYTYRSAPLLQSFLKEIGESDQPRWATAAQSLAKLDARRLESISTILYLRQRGLSGTALAERFANLKPNLAAEYSDALSQSISFVPELPNRVS